MKKRLIDFMLYTHSGLTARDISINLFIIGFVSTSVQLLLMREIMNISGGYELITGIYLGSWLFSSAAGSYFAGKWHIKDIGMINLIFSVSPFLSIFLLFLTTRVVLDPGETPDFLKSIIITFPMLLPFCFASGFTFIKLISIGRTDYGYIPGKSFSIETTGGIIAGISLSVLASGILNTGQILVIILFPVIVYALLTFFITDNITKFLIKIMFAIISASALLAGPDVFIRQMLMPGIKVNGTKDTPYGNITVGIFGEEESTYYNQRLLLYTDDAIEREENIHYALLQSDNPRNILLISGSLVSSLHEINKYDPESVIYVENDPGLIKYTSISTDTLRFRVNIITKDAFRFIREYGKTTDAVILLLPPPSSLALNRFYTIEFFKDVKKILTPSGIFMCSPGPGDYYLNKESINLYSSIYNSLAGVFRSVIPVAGNKLYFIASDSELSLSYCRISQEKQINNLYVNCDFISDDLIKKKSQEILSAIDRNIKKNSSDSPIACFHYQSYHLSRNSSAKSIMFIILVLVFASSMILIRRENILMYLSASSLAGFEIIMLLVLQLTVGNMYHLTGIVIASMMAGLAAGSGSSFNKAENIPVRVIAVVLLLFYCLTAICLNVLLSFSGAFAVIFIIIIIIPPSFLTGHIFRKLTIQDINGYVSSSVYSADLAGSALGFMIVSTLIIPVFGIKFAIFFLSILIFAGILPGTKNNKSIPFS